MYVSVRLQLDSGVTAVHYIPHEYKDVSRNNSIKCSGDNKMTCLMLNLYMCTFLQTKYAHE